MSEIKITDKLGLTDNKKTLRGIVSIFDNIKKEFIIKNKENLIMNTGREFVKQLFILNSGILGSTTDVKFPTQLADTFHLSACVFGTNSDISKPDMMYIPENYIQDYTILTSSPEFSLTFSDEMVLQITIALNGLSTNQTMISDIALVLTTGEDDNSVAALLASGDTTNTALFSRLVFDPMPVGAGTSQTITYCIYF